MYCKLCSDIVGQFQAASLIFINRINDDYSKRGAAFLTRTYFIEIKSGPILGGRHLLNLCPNVSALNPIHPHPSYCLPLTLSPLYPCPAIYDCNSYRYTLYARIPHLIIKLSFLAVERVRDRKRLTEKHLVKYMVSKSMCQSIQWKGNRVICREASMHQKR